jgi:hypothetical protein
LKLFGTNYRARQSNSLIGTTNVRRPGMSDRHLAAAAALARATVVLVGVFIAAPL